ncbi:unnamed protein product, partial [Prorocentrum cordatum]
DNLKKHEQIVSSGADGARTEDEVGEKFRQLDKKSQMSAWKMFEKSRQSEGNDADYKNSTKGTGSNEKKTRLLKKWILDKGKCGNHYLGYLQEINLDKSRKVEEDWVPFATAEKRWGKEELAARVKSGTIRARRDPKDTRFWEFQVVTDMTSVTCSFQKKLQLRSDSKKAVDNKTFHRFQVADPTKLDEHDFMIQDNEVDDSEVEDDAGDIDVDLAKTLGIKNSKGKGNAPKGGKPIALDWDAMSDIDGVSKDDVQMRMIKFKEALEKDESFLDKVSIKYFQRDPKGHKDDINKHRSYMKKMTNILDEIKQNRNQSKIKKDSAKKTMIDSIALMRLVKAFKVDLKKRGITITAKKNPNKDGIEEDGDDEL